MTDRKDLVRLEGLDVRLWNDRHRDGLSERIEKLQSTARLSTFRMRNVVHQSSYVPSLQPVLDQILGQSHTFVKGVFHRRFSQNSPSCTAWPGRRKASV